jgi:hypothetical protein
MQGDLIEYEVLEEQKIMMTWKGKYQL